ncbi:MAG: caspase family protein [Candidatus Eisenbacteria bacterium]|nr:caspase family protein [Candidatus Eisenbacteria bacterium]
MGGRRQQYANKAQGISSLRFAVKDAEAIYRSLVDEQSGGFDPANVTLLTDNTEEKPTSATIGKALNRIITQAKENDLVVIYFSGHGYEEDGRAYLLPANADLEALDYSAIERDAFVRQIDKIPANKVIVVLDACHSGGVNRGGKGVGRDAALAQSYYERFAGSQGRAFIASSSGGELSWEDEAEGHGVFTQALARGMSGAADTAPRDGIVTLQELRTYFESQVSTWAGQRGKSQHPQINLESARGDIPMAINFAFFAEESRDLTARRDESQRLLSGLTQVQGLEPGEAAAAIGVVNRYGRGEALEATGLQHLDFVRKLVDGSIDTNMYRAGAPKAVLPNAEALGMGVRKRSLFSNKWFLGGMGIAVADAAAALGGGGGGASTASPQPLGDPPGHP